MEQQGDCRVQHTRLQEERKRGIDDVGDAVMVDETGHGGGVEAGQDWECDVKKAEMEVKPWHERHGH